MSLTAFRAELLSVPEDPAQAGDSAVRHHADGLLVVEDGFVVAFGAHADLAPRFADVPVETMPGLIVPGFVDTHIHYPQTDRIAAYGNQLLEWLEHRIFPLSQVNDAMAALNDRNGGFTNFIVDPTRAG